MEPNALTRLLRAGRIRRIGHGAFVTTAVWTGASDARALSPPREQARIAVVGGGVARVDFLLPAGGVVVEFDGAVEYEGADGREALVREKRREDAIRAAGHPVVRLSWPELERPTRARALLMAAGWRATS